MCKSQTQYDCLKSVASKAASFDSVLPPNEYITITMMDAVKTAITSAKLADMNNGATVVKPADTSSATSMTTIPGVDHGSGSGVADPARLPAIKRPQPASPRNPG